MVKLNKIYTRTGDDGTTGLVDGSRVAKSSALMAAIGDVDEANSLIGVAAVHATGEMLGTLRTIQNDMFDLGADIATPDGDFGWEPLRIVPAQVVRLEHEIDAMNVGLQPLTSFILPGGAALAAHLHVARAAVRRAQRAGDQISQPLVGSSVYNGARGEWQWCRRNFVGARRVAVTEPVSRSNR